MLCFVLKKKSSKLLWSKFDNRRPCTYGKEQKVVKGEMVKSPIKKFF